MGEYEVVSGFILYGVVVDIISLCDERLCVNRVPGCHNTYVNNQGNAENP